MDQALIDHLAEVLQHAREHSIDLGAYLEKLIALEDRIASAPRAWGVKIEGRPLSPHEAYNTEHWAHKEAALRPGSRVVPIALIELKEGE